MQAYHRQKRKKEVQKSKEQRIKARDEKVVQSKTAAEVQEEIRNLKRRKNLQASEQQKLQRLEKELKLVKEAAANRPKPQLVSEPQSKPLTELDDPRKSVYYDEKLNPYGAPPPGKPRLYHQRGGGVTMDIKMAIVPGEEPPPPPPPPPPPNRPPVSSGRPQGRAQANHRQRSEPSSRDESCRESAPVPGKSAPKVEHSNDKPPEKEKEESDDKPLVAPGLPPPSKSVQRSRRGKATADIWASNEEVEYERRANQVDLEADDIGTATPKKPSKPKKKKPPLEIYYQDRSGQVQGPFDKGKMQGWFAGGFFPPTTLVKTNRNDKWVPINELQALQQESPQTQQEELVESRIAALKTGNGPEGRISALKTPQNSSVEDRIAALKQQTQNAEEDEDENAPSAIEQRIAALRAGKTREADDEDADPYGPAPPPPPPGPPDADGGGPPAYPVEDDVAAYPVEDAQYPGVEDEMDAQALHYPEDDDPDETTGVAPHVASEDLPTYPVDDTSETAYPLEDGDQDVSSPMNDAYLVDEGDREDVAYPVTDSYPVTDGYPPTDGSGTNDEGAPIYPLAPPTAEKPKKSIKVDKEVVAFMPSHLQNRKRKATLQSAVKPKKTKPVPAAAQTTKDDYVKFLEEIEGFDGS